MARANKKKFGDIANESDSKYDKVKLAAAAITETFREDDDGAGHNEEALVYLKLKLEDIVDDINVLATDVVDLNTAKVGTTSTERTRIAANHAKVGTTSTERTRIAANHAKVGISTVQAGIVNNLHPEAGALIPTATDGCTVAASVTKTERGVYALVFTMVDSREKTAVTKTVTLALR